MYGHANKACCCCCCCCCVVSVTAFFCKFIYAQPYAIPEWENIVTFRPNGRPNMQFTPLYKRDDEHPRFLTWVVLPRAWNPDFSSHLGKSKLVP